jgi:peroxiredoxin Q/BCP
MRTFFIGLAAILAAVTVQGAELAVGDMAPDFTLKASDGKTYKLSDFRGKQAVAIAWFPKAFTQGCTIECKSLAENGHLIKKFDVAYFMASIDPVEDNAAFAKATAVTLGQGDNKRVVDKKEADFPILSDPEKTVAEAYGVLRDYGGTLGVLPSRWTFYIGKDGRIQAIDKMVKPASSAEDMAAKLSELKVAMR